MPKRGPRTGAHVPPDQAPNAVDIFVDEFRASYREGAGTGLRLELRGRCGARHRTLPHNVYLDLHGDAMWGSTPIMVQSLSGSILPIRLREYKWKAVEAEKEGGGDDDAADEAEKESPYLTFTMDIMLGKYRLKHDTLLNFVTMLAGGGDHAFVFHVKERDETNVFAFAVKPSDILESLTGASERAVSPTKASAAGADADVAAAAPSGTTSSSIWVSPRPGAIQNWRIPHTISQRYGRRGKTGVFSWLRWGLLPTLFAAGSWACYLRPADVMAAVPSLVAQMGKSLSETLPVYPKSLSEAFAYGRIAEKLDALLPAGGDPSSLLDEAGKIAGRVVSVADVHAIAETIAEIEARRGVVSRTLGGFSLINMVWLLSIAGVSVSVGPAAWALLAPIRKYIKTLLTNLWERVLHPILLRLHRWGVIEALCYAGSFALLADGYRFGPEHATSGTMVSLTGVALALVPCLAYSTALHGVDIIKRLSRRTVAVLTGVTIAATTAPLALAQQSTLIGYLTMAGVFQAAGFSVVCHGCCWLIGFDSESALHSGNIVAGASLAAFALADVYARENPAVQHVVTPFRSAGLVLGGVVHYIAMLIMSSDLYYDIRRKPELYAKMQALMIGSLSLGLGTGYLHNLEGLANTCTTFLVLYLTEKWVELHARMRWNRWVLMLLLSLAAYKGSLYCHRNPDFVAAMLA